MWDLVVKISISIARKNCELGVINVEKLFFAG